MNVNKVLVPVAVLLFGMSAWAQEFPRFEGSLDYSYMLFHPSVDFTQNHNMNGGGGTFKVNFNPWFGFEMDLQGYSGHDLQFIVPPSPAFPTGGSGKTGGNIFTYMFGPEVKDYGHRFQPFMHTLVGGAHSNIYANATKTICQPTAAGCSTNVNTSETGLAFAVGGGFDIPLNKMISIRPAEVDYLLTRFTNQFVNNTQNNFRLSAGVVFTFE